MTNTSKARLERAEGGAALTKTEGRYGRKGGNGSVGGAERKSGKCGRSHLGEGQGAAAPGGECVWRRNLLGLLENSKRKSFFRRSPRLTSVLFISVGRAADLARGGRGRKAAEADRL